MKNDIIHINPVNENVTLTTYIRDDTSELKMPPRRAMLVLPGGGYHICSDREAEPIAIAYMGFGFNAFVLRYSLKEHSLFPQPLIEASLAVKHIRDNAEKYNIDPHQIYVVGFSAGGHLAGCIATMWHKQFIYDKIDMPYGANKPDGAVLSYAVLSHDEGAGPVSLFDKIFASRKPTDDELKMSSPADNVDENTVPVFVWQTSNDNVVPVRNSLYMCERLAEHGILFELHVYPKGPHGISLATTETCSANSNLLDDNVSGWVDLSVAWIKSL